MVSLFTVGFFFEFIKDLFTVLVKAVLGHAGGSIGICAEFLGKKFG
jgi:hypothetical protein